MKKIILTLLLSCYFSLAYAYCPESVNRLIALMAERAALMKQVAAYKWTHSYKHHATPYDAAQELKILRHANIFARWQHMPAGRLLVFTQIQMDLSKQIEQYWFNRWNNPRVPIKDKPNIHHVLSLAQLRDEIIAIDKVMYPEIKATQIQLAVCSNNELVRLFMNHFHNIQGVPRSPSFFAMMAAAIPKTDNL